MKRWTPFAAFGVLAVSYMALSPLLQSQRGVLEQSDEFTLLSLEPSPFKPSPPGAVKFHKHIILGQVKITDPKLKARLTEALFRGIADDKMGGASCFNPRHGIRAVKGSRVVEASICFECGHVYFFDWRDSHATISRSPVALFDATLRASRVRVAAPLH